MDADFFEDSSYGPTKKQRREPNVDNLPGPVPILSFPKQTSLPPVPVVLITADTIKLDYNTSFTNLSVFPDLRVDAGFVAVACPELLQSIRQNNISSFPKPALKLLIDMLYEKPIQQLTQNASWNCCNLHRN